MRRDTIFYRLFSQAPELLFELLDDPPANAADYRFNSVGVKEPKFEIDGVFLPPQTDRPGVVFYCEVQFQKDPCLYERLFGESFLHFYRNRSSFSDWRAVVIYPSRSIEQVDRTPYSDLLDGPRVDRIYLNELGEIEDLPIDVALMVLTTSSKRQAPALAKTLADRTQSAELPESKRQGIIEILTAIMVYKFTTLTRQEVEAMLGLTTLQETRFYQDAKSEGREEGREEGEQIGETRGQQSLTQRLLECKVGVLSPTMLQQIEALSPPQIEALAIALLDFTQLLDLEAWLQSQPKAPDISPASAPADPAAEPGANSAKTTPPESGSAPVN
jgi:predicted transposase/invertase (TIGR01784 family)